MYSNPKLRKIEPLDLLLWSCLTSTAANIIIKAQELNA